MAKSPLSYAAYILALIGGILLALFSLLALLNIFSLPFRSPLGGLNIFGHDLITLILGAVSIIGSKYVDKLEWAIILIVVGYFAGGIGLLVLLGGVLGLVSRLIKHR